MAMGGTRRGAVAFAAAMIALVGAPGVANAAPGHRAPRPLVGLAAARHDVGALRRAHTSAARLAAVEQILRRVGLPVLASGGRRLVPGRIRGAGDLYLYEPELRMLAGQLARREVTSFDDLAATLSARGATQNGAPLSGAALQAAVRTATLRDARRPRSKASTYGWIVRRLGQARGADPARARPSAAPSLDALQRLLVTTALVAPLVRPAAHARTALGAEGLVRPAAHAAGACDFANSQGGAASAIAGLKYLAGFGFPPIGIANAALDLFHGTLLGYSVGFKKLSPALVTGAFGQSGPRSAQAMRFQLEVDMLDDVPQSVIDCGWLLGYTIPPKGPISGAKVGWTQLDYLKQLGTVDCPTTTCQATGADGVATLTFQPDDEVLPGVGEGRVAHGFIDADVFIQQATNNASGTVAEGLLGLTKGDAFGWEVSWHQPRGYGVEVPDFTVQRRCNSESSDTCSYAYTTVRQYQCLAQMAGVEQHPTRPRPGLGFDASGGLATLGDQRATITDPDGGTSDQEATFSMAADLPGGPLDHRAWEDGTQTGHWLFDAAHPTLQYEATFSDPGATPQATTFPGLAVSEATQCPPLAPYPQQPT